MDRWIDGYVCVYIYIYIYIYITESLLVFMFAGLGPSYAKVGQGAKLSPLRIRMLQVSSSYRWCTARPRLEVRKSAVDESVSGVQYFAPRMAFTCIFEGSARFSGLWCKCYGQFFHEALKNTEVVMFFNAVVLLFCSMFCLFKANR